MLDLIYPKRCIFCEKAIQNFGSVCICPSCKKIRPVPKIVKDDGFIFDEAVGVLKYEGSVRKSMLKFKFESVKYYGSTFARIIYDTLGSSYIDDDAIMCCVPMSPSRDRKYNQTLIIADGLAKMYNVRLTADLMYKQRDLPPLSKMNVNERKINISGAFEVNPVYNIRNKNVIVIDDIYTSGATANECAKTLKAYGAQRVGIICACYD